MEGDDVVLDPFRTVRHVAGVSVLDVIRFPNARGNQCQSGLIKVDLLTVDECDPRAVELAVEPCGNRQTGRAGPGDHDPGVG
nr:hypothetical protein [Spiribacter curvatus]